jgi:hypothetical protein
MEFQLELGTVPPPAGFGFELWIQRPNHVWAHYLSGVTTPLVSFVPDAGNGTYRFAARLRKSDHTSSAFAYSENMSVGSSSALQWVHQIGTTTEDDVGGIAVDANANSYVAGATAGTLPDSPEPNAGGLDVFVAKYDAQGDRQWVHQLGSAGGEQAQGISVDANGNVYITGWTTSTLPGSAEPNAGGYDAFVAKYDTNGNRLWVHQLGSATDDFSYGVGVDANGNAYLAGYTPGTLPGSSEPNAGSADIFVAKYDTNGSRLWVHQLGSANSDVAFGIAVDANGSAYLTGYTNGTLPGSPEPFAGDADLFVAKYDANGNRQWVHELGSGAADGGKGIAVDANGNAYVTGSTDGTLPGSIEPNAGGADVFVAKYDTDGNRQWVHQLGTGESEQGAAVATDVNGDLYVTGETPSLLPGNSDPKLSSCTAFPPFSSCREDMFVTKYDTSGNRLWVHQLGSSGWDQGSAIATDVNGDAYVTGITRETMPGSPEPHAGTADYADVYIAKYLPTG